MLRYWLSGEAAPFWTGSLSFVPVLGGESDADAGYFVRIFRCIRAVSLTMSIGEKNSVVVWWSPFVSCIKLFP